MHSQWDDPRVVGWVEEYGSGTGGTGGEGGAAGGAHASPQGKGKGKGWPSTPPPKMRSPHASPKVRLPRLEMLSLAL